MSLFAALKSKNTFAATLLITGCCIGAGMIGLPVVSALAGFIPSSIAMLLCYFFTTLTGLLLLEATLWFDQKVNLLTITEFALGKIGKLITCILFLFLFYCLFVAYLDGGGQLFSDMLSALFRHPISRTIGVLTCTGVVAGITYAGARIVAGLNYYLLFGVVAAYLLLVIVGFSYVNPAHLTHMNFNAAVATIPILLICFGFQNLVPTLTYYLQKNVNAIRFAIIVGNFIPFLIYLLWNFVILGMLPVEQAHATQANNVAELLQGTTGIAAVIIYVKAFSLFAILTSFLPSALSFMDFIQDGFKQAHIARPKNGIPLILLTFVPPLICTLYYPNLFLQALGFAGGFIDVLLFGMLPAIVVLIGRAKNKIQSPYQVMGGKFIPVAILILSLGILLLRFL